MAELTHLIADYKNAAQRPPGTPQMNSLTRHGSRRSLRKPSTLPHSSPSTLPLAHQLSHSHHGANTLNSRTTTLGSDR